MDYPYFNINVMSDTMDAREEATALDVIDVILRDLYDRKGLKQEFDRIYREDESTYHHMLKVWKDDIATTLRGSFGPLPGSPEDPYPFTVKEEAIPRTDIKEIQARASSEYCECEKPLIGCAGNETCFECRKSVKPASVGEIQKAIQTFMTQTEIRAKRAEYAKQLEELDRQIKHVVVDIQHLHLDCKHPNKYSHNAMGRDPNGARCDDCGKCW